jgi:hypothetical protein
VLEVVAADLLVLDAPTPAALLSHRRSPRKKGMADRPLRTLWGASDGSQARGVEAIHVTYTSGVLLVYG